VAAFRHLDRLLHRAISLLDTNRPIVRSWLESRNDLAWAPSAGTVVFPRLRRVNDASAFAERLMNERDTAVVPGRFFQAPPHLRIGFGGPTDTVRAGLRAIAETLDQI